MVNDQKRKTIVSREFIRRFGAPPTLWTQSPGRVDLMGSHTDYNEGYVLTMAIDRTLWIAARPREDGRVVAASLDVDGVANFTLDDITYDQAHLWTNYIRGVASVFKAEGYALRGFDGLIHSAIPVGSGLSSSAALEVGTAMLFEALGDWDIDPVQMALLCQKAENTFVGMSCGILDQYTVTMGKAGHAVVLDCRHLTSEAASIPADIQVVICDTRAERALAGSEYTIRRAQCEEGAARMAEFYPDVKTLRDVAPAQLEAHKGDLPEVVEHRCRFIIEESLRVSALADALSNDDRPAIGALTAASFEGARALYEIVSPEMEAMIEAMRGAPGVIGARQAGAGFGGCMVAFVERTHVEQFGKHVRLAYQKQTSIEAEVYLVQAVAGASIV
jgi:galactokinase